MKSWGLMSCCEIKYVCVFNNSLSHNKYEIFQSRVLNTIRDSVFILPWDPHFIMFCIVINVQRLKSFIGNICEAVG